MARTATWAAATTSVETSKRTLLPLAAVFARNPLAGGTERGAFGRDEIPRQQPLGAFPCSPSRRAALAPAASLPHAALQHRSDTNLWMVAQ